MKKLPFLLFFFVASGSGQYYKSLVANTNSFDATAYNNCHKIVVKNLTKGNDSIYVVYHSADSLFYIYSRDEGHTWQAPIYLYPGKHPAIDMDQTGHRHIVYESPNNNAIYYDCLNDAFSPIKVNVSNRICSLPDLVVDSNFVVHIVWQEDLNGKRHIYYRNYSNGSFSDTLRLSNYGAVNEDNTSPSISIFSPNKRIYVVWVSVDSSSYTPFHIASRYNENGNWSQLSTLFDHYRTLRNASLDYSHGSDVLSVCWEDSSTGNLEARFYGGNSGGGYPTFGLSSYPVISTVGTTWSYLFWNEDSSDYRDIYYHLYYVTTGWYGRNTIRNLFSINESIRFPNVCGAYVIWTQGDIPPYKIYFANFGYPIGITEEIDGLCNSENYLIAEPNPFSNATKITFQNSEYAERILQTIFQSQCPKISIQIYDISGRIVKSFNPALLVFWDGTDNSGCSLPDGVYFLKIKGMERIRSQRLVKIE
uniref:T9SS type A sorting domain-containing protein n=1 Tax=candidate division WOR-3 bacterium TaxID=2052148 RepID=A0A7C6EMB6_UNCW3